MNELAEEMARIGKAEMQGGPAFPPAGYGNGMTLRDWFAGQVAPAVYEEQVLKRWLQPERMRAEAAEESYALADAMLAERDKARE